MTENEPTTDAPAPKPRYEPATVKPARAAVAADWGTAAWAKLSAIRGQHSRKKRITLLMMANVKLTGAGSYRKVFKNRAAGSSVSHYKWMAEDATYAAAYAFLIGSDDQPGLAPNARMERENEEMAAALAAIGEARLILSENAPAAALALVAGLGAANPADSIRAANSILDRNPDTAAGRRQVIAGDDDNPLTFRTTQDLTDDELAAIIAAGG